MTVRTAAGTTIKITSVKPATFDAAGYGAAPVTTGLVNIGEIIDLGEFGRVFELIKHKPLGTRGTTKMKGSFDDGQVTVKVGLDTDDAGQILLKAGAMADGNYSFCIAPPGGDKYYFQAKVMSFKPAIGSVDSIITASVTLEIDTDSATGTGIVEVLAP